MPLALWTLLWLNFRAVLRRTARQMKSVRGILFFLIGLGALGMWLGPSIFLNLHVRPANHSNIHAVMPVIVLLLTVMNLLTSAGERAVTFTPAEVDFLFPGPFSRRQLLTYKLGKTAMAGFFSALIYAVMLGRFGGVYQCRVVGIWLLFQFLQLLAMVIAMLQETVGTRLVTAGRRWVVITIAGASALAVFNVISHQHDLSLNRVVMDAEQTTAGRIVLAPFDVFARAILANEFLFEGLSWSLVALAIDLLLVAVVLGMDANFLETSTVVSARRYARLSRMRRSGLMGLSQPKSGSLKIAMLPWLAGTGPIIWRQMTTALRTTRTLVIILVLAAIGCGVMISRNTELSASIGMIVGISVYLNLFVSRMLKFDFQGDLDHLDLLRSLPIRPAAVAMAQLVAPAVILCVIQFALLITLAIEGNFPLRYLLAVGVFAVPINLLALGFDNLMFLLFPFRPRTAVAGDMTMMGRQAILAVCRLMLLLLAAGIAAGFGLAVWMVNHQSWIAIGIATWIPLVICVGVIVWLIGLLFGRFDPSRHTPA